MTSSLFAGHAAVTAAALAIDAAFGYPDALFARIGHPASWIGAVIARLDAALNRDAASPLLRRLAGVVALVALLALALIAGLLLEQALGSAPFGGAALAVLGSSLIAQRSLYDHVEDVENALESGLDDARRSVARIVGRDAGSLDRSGVARAAIESLSENFSDGVVAPAFWMLLFGLPGALAYKALNTADSMIGHRTSRHGEFGFASARLDDLANLPCSRLSALLLSLGCVGLPFASARAALATALRDARRHLSPNAGWPEAAMAGALGLSLGGPRSYEGVELQAALLGAGRRDAGPADIRRALRLYRRACVLLFVMVLIGATLAAI